MKKISQLTALGFYLSIYVMAQLSCNDPKAAKYNPNALSNEMRYFYPLTVIHPKTIGNIDVAENSGIIYFDGRLFTHNDSGGEPELYELKPETGKTVRTYRLKGLCSADIGDWEEIDQNENYVFIGDIGNNNGTRKNLVFYRINKSFFKQKADTVWVEFEAIPFFYPEQINFSSTHYHNFDCEAFVAIKDTLFMFTKHRGNLNTNLYKVLNIPNKIPQAAQLLDSFNAGGQITGASYDSIGNELILGGYLDVASPFIWFYWGFKSTQFFDGYARRIELPPPAITGQFEAICFTQGSNIILSNEGLTDAIPAKISSFKNRFTFNPSTNIIAQPEFVVAAYGAGEKLIYVESIAKAQLKVYDVLGNCISSTEIMQGKQTIDMQSIEKGIYILAFNHNEQVQTKKIIIF